MFKPIDLKRYLAKNYELMLKDYNPFLFILSFVIIPISLSTLVIIFIDSQTISGIINKSISFFSIIVGFLINILVLLLAKSKMDKNDKLEKDIEKLRKHLSFNVLNAIIFGLVLVIFILFYGNYDLIFNIKSYAINISEFIILILLFHVMMLLLNIIRKFGVYIETRYV